MKTTFVIDRLLATSPGEPYRLLPFGEIHKAGVTINFTREYAAKFRLPHFKPPILLGSHTETTPAGGHIVGLEVRKDGLYAVPEFNEKGLQALRDGAYRYHSPEVLWEGRGFEDPGTGATIEGPIIVGDALLHAPHMGEATALYQAPPRAVVQVRRAPAAQAGNHATLHAAIVKKMGEAPDLNYLKALERVRADTSELWATAAAVVRDTRTSPGRAEPMTRAEASASMNRIVRRKMESEPGLDFNAALRTLQIEDPELVENYQSIMRGVRR